MDNLLKRLKEPSTYAGLTGFLVALGVFGWTPEDWQTVWQGVIVVSTLLSVFLGEGSSE